MKLLLFLNELVIGGTLVNAIELAEALREKHGFDVVFFSAPGPMVEILQEKRIRLIPAPLTRSAPSLTRMRALRAAVRQERPDIVWAWESPPCLDALCAMPVPRRLSLVVSIMTMDIFGPLPRSVQMTFGTPQLVDEAVALGHIKARLMVPPVNVDVNDANAVDKKATRRQYSITDDEITLVTVSRLADSMKSESLIYSIRAVRQLGREMPLRLVIVGDGEARGKLEKLAGEVNLELGRPAVLLAGAHLDPRPAYASADIVIGMGGSALRGMAFGKPTIVVGENGFAAAFTPETESWFHYHGIFGRGGGDGGEDRLVASIRSLANNPNGWPVLGEFSRQFVCRHFSLEVVAAQMAELFNEVGAERRRPFVTALDSVNTVAQLALDGHVSLKWGLRRQFRKIVRGGSRRSEAVCSKERRA